MAIAAESLKQYGITFAESQRLNRLDPHERQKELRQNLEAYTNEVLADKPVSILYHYWPGNNNRLYTDASRKEIFDVESQFDPAERGGLPLEGFVSVKNLLLNNPGALVAWYSPPGPAAFDDNPANPYAAIEYPDGQFYLQYLHNGKVNAVSVKVNHDDFINQMPQWFVNRLARATDEKDRIKAAMTAPFVIANSPEEFFNRARYDCPVYTDKHNRTYTVSDILKAVRETWSGEIQPSIPQHDRTLASLAQFEATEEFILKAYAQAIQNHLRQTGQKTVTLSGSCGGSEVSAADIEAILENSRLPVNKVLGPMSSAGRAAPFAPKKDGDNYEDYECPNCHTMLSGESKTDKAKWRPACEHCGHKFGDKCK